MWTEAEARRLMADHPVPGLTVRDYTGGDGQAIRIEVRNPGRFLTRYGRDTAAIHRFIVAALEAQPDDTDVYTYVDSIRIYLYESRPERVRGLRDPVDDSRLLRELERVGAIQQVDLPEDDEFLDDILDDILSDGDEED